MSSGEEMKLSCNDAKRLLDFYDLLQSDDFFSEPAILVNEIFKSFLLLVTDSAQLLEFAGFIPLIFSGAHRVVN